MSGGWVYIMTNKPGGVLYTGVTANLAARVCQHRENCGSSVCRRYAEPHQEIGGAISREKQIKAWRRSWKIELIEAANPTWSDLFARLA